MDANEREPAHDVSTGGGTAARMKRELTGEAQSVKESLNDLGPKTEDRMGGSRESTAKALAWTATSLHSQTDKMSQLAHSAADRIQVGADYLRERDVERIVEDVRAVVKKYPGRSLAAAAILGFLWRGRSEGRRPGNEARGSITGTGKSKQNSNPDVKQAGQLNENVARLVEENKMKRDADIQQIATERRGSVLGFLLAGMGIGAALSVLAAPRPGVETRGRIAHKCLDGIEAANMKVRSARLQIQDLMDRSQRRVTSAVATGHQRFRSAEIRTRDGDL
jgi:gas vesicle protein